MTQPRVVLDTNVYISGLVFGDIPAKLLELAVGAAFILCVSPALREEVVQTLMEKFQWTDQQIELGCGPLWQVAVQVKPAVSLAVIAADPDDDRILECALAGEADIIVTGDDHLVNLNPAPPPPVSNFRILTPRQFLDVLASR